jgi:hypothetical protein
VGGTVRCWGPQRRKEAEATEKNQLLDAALGVLSYPAAIAPSSAVMLRIYNQLDARLNSAMDGSVPVQGNFAEEQPTMITQFIV